MDLPEENEEQEAPQASPQDQENVESEESPAPEGQEAPDTPSEELGTEDGDEQGESPDPAGKEPGQDAGEDAGDEANPSSVDGEGESSGESSADDEGEASEESQPGQSKASEGESEGDGEQGSEEADGEQAGSPSFDLPEDPQDSPSGGELVEEDAPSTPEGESEEDSDAECAESQEDATQEEGTNEGDQDAGTQSDDDGTEESQASEPTGPDVWKNEEVLLPEPTAPALPSAQAGGGAGNLFCPPSHSPLNAETIESMARSLTPLLKASTRPGLEQASMTRGRFSYDRHVQGAERQFRHRSHPTREEAVVISFIGDCSYSMLSMWTVTHTRAQGVQAAASVFTRASDLAAEAAEVITFDTSVYPVIDSQTAREDALATVGFSPAFTPKGGTCLTPALTRVVHRQVPQNKHHLVVIACDGELDESDVLTCRNLMRQAPENLRVLPLLIGQADLLPSWRVLFPDAALVRNPEDLVRVGRALLTQWRAGPWRGQPA